MTALPHIDNCARRRERLGVDYKDETHNALLAHDGCFRGLTNALWRCRATVRRQFLSHYFSYPPRWRLWIRHFDKMRALPDFCVIGPTKSGTSDLALTIMSHPNVLCPLVKELPSSHPPAWKLFYPTAKAVRRHAQRYGVALCPLVGPYLHCLDIPVALSALRPDTKIVIVLRNPVDLTFSMWKWTLLHKERQLVDNVPFLASFPAYVDKALDRIHELPGPLAAVLQSGIYAISVAEWLRAFGEQNVRVLDVGEYFKDRNVVFRRIEPFLGLPHAPMPQLLSVVNRNPLELPPDPETCAKLREYFHPYNRRLWEVIGTEYPW